MLNIRDDGKTIRDVAYEAVAAMDALAHCDQAGGIIFSAPATFAILPTPGMFRAVHCGVRNTSTVDEIKAACAMRPRDLAFEVVVGPSAFTPSQLIVQATSIDVLSDLARSLGVALPSAPVAFQLLSIAGSVEEYLQGLQWKSQPEPNWTRTDFNATAMMFGKPTEHNGGIRLSRYWNERRHRVEYLIWRGADSASVDPSWGRFAVLSAHSITAIQVSEKYFTFSVPTVLPLPPVISRALTLCAGSAPDIGTIRDRRSYPCTTYGGVPPDVLDSVVRKLGQ